MANKVGMLAGIEPTSPSFQADMLPLHYSALVMTVPKLHSLTLPWTVDQEVEGGFWGETGLELRVNSTLQCMWVNQGKA